MRTCAAAGCRSVIKRGKDLWILAFVPAGRRADFAEQLAPLNAKIVFIAGFAEAAIAIREDHVFQVALLPGDLSDTTWWELWGVLTGLHPSPAILVYTRDPSFQMWSGVLDVGGHDVVVEPFSDEELQDAVLRAAKGFEEHPENSHS
jgi:DNA-binding NtrC family response regulator